MSLTLNNVNDAISKECGNIGSNVALGDPLLAMDFGVEPSKLFWGTYTDCAAKALDQIPNVVRSSRSTDVRSLHTWTDGDVIVVLEPQGA